MYRNTYIEINVKNLKNNVKNILNVYPEYQYYIGVVKGNAYGHGSACVKYLVESGINYLAVASLEEAIAIRKRNINIPILCLEPIDLAYMEECIKYNVTITVHSYEYYKQLSSLPINEPLKIHLKIDSGMCRLGFDNKTEIEEVVSSIHQHRFLKLEGIFTHFATDGIYDTSWDNQLNRFLELTSEISLESIPIVHLGKSQTLLNHKKIPFANGIRLGILLYGFNTTPKPLPNTFLNKLRMIKRNHFKKKNHISETKTDCLVDLQAAFSLHSEVIQVKKIKKGSFVGYGRIYEAPEDMYIAIVPIGYSDGFSRRNQNRCVVIQKKRYPIIGFVNMGMIILKVDSSIKVQDKVTLIGQDIPISEVATRLGTTVYETMCMHNSWIPRVLVEDNKILEIDETVH